MFKIILFADWVLRNSYFLLGVVEFLAVTVNIFWLVMLCVLSFIEEYLNFCLRVQFELRCYRSHLKKNINLWHKLLPINSESFRNFFQREQKLLITAELQSWEKCDVASVYDLLLVFLWYRSCAWPMTFG